MSCCGGKCGCGSGCQCGSGCNGCGMYPDISERNNTVSVVAGIAPVKAYYEDSEMSYGAENGGCNCGADCKCGSSCACGK